MKNQWFNLAGVLGLMVFVLWLSIQIFAPLHVGDEANVMFKIEKGQRTKDIAKDLENQRFIRSSGFFQAYGFLTGVSHKLQAGEYLLSPSLSLSQIVKKLATGDIHKKPVTFVEGWLLKDHPELLEIAGKDFSQEFDFLKDKPKSLSLEGYLFPDTYFVRTDKAPESVVQRMLQNFEKHFTLQLRTETQRQKKTIFQIVTMASLLEKEVRGFGDRKIVAGILWKRLSIGMALQVDAAMETYKYPGLPLGPIANPGIESILAALYPTESPYWYYLSTPQGDTIFSKTLEEHNIAKAKYLSY